MPELSRNALVLRYLLEVAPGVGHIKLAKFAYLADLEARKYLARPISQFRYIRDQHGPFDARAFFSARDELVGRGFATETPVECGPYVEYQMHPTSRVPEYDFSVPESEVLSYVALTYMSKTARDLCEDIVYRTPPMQNLKLGDEVPMDKLDGESRDKLGFSLERMLAGEASAEAGRVRPMAEVVNELRARYH
jgi:hypothetical protein